MLKLQRLCWYFAQWALLLHACLISILTFLYRWICFFSTSMIFIVKNSQHNFLWKATNNKKKKRSINEREKIQFAHNDVILVSPIHSLDVEVNSPRSFYTWIFLSAKERERHSFVVSFSFRIRCHEWKLCNDINGYVLN